MNQRYLVSVFLKGKCVHSFFSPNLDDLVTIKALYKDGDINIFDFDRFTHLTKAEVIKEIYNSGQRWKDSLEKKIEAIEEPVKEVELPPVKKTGKSWRRKVLCIETGQVFSTCTDCSNHIGLPYMTIMNCIKNGNATRGLHFTIIDNET